MAFLLQQPEWTMDPQDLSGSFQFSLESLCPIVTVSEPYDKYVCLVLEHATVSLINVCRCLTTFAVRKHQATGIHIRPLHKHGLEPWTMSLFTLTSSSRILILMVMFQQHSSVDPLCFQQLHRVNETPDGRLCELIQSDLLSNHPFGRHDQCNTVTKEEHNRQLCMVWQ